MMVCCTVFELLAERSLQYTVYIDELVEQLLFTAVLYRAICHARIHSLCGCMHLLAIWKDEFSGEVSYYF
jgi:hypothetical protein